MLLHRVSPRAAWFLLIVSLVAPSWCYAQQADDRANQVSAINQALSKFQNDQPAPSQRRLRLAYFVPSDRKAAENYRLRLTRVIDEARRFYAEQISGYGLHARPLPVDRDDDGLLRIVMVQGQQPCAAYNGKAPVYGARIHNECLPVLEQAGIDAQHETIAVFTAVMDWDPAQRRFRQTSPYQGTGDATHGFCWQIDAPPLDPIHLPERSPNIDDGEYGVVTLGKWNSLFVGGVIHELGHAFGLPHNAQPPAQLRNHRISLMGAGNREYGNELRGMQPATFLTFADAVRLVSHPLFSGSEKAVAEGSGKHHAFENIQVQPDRGRLIVTGHVRSTPPTYAIVAYTDPDGRDDYDAIATVSVPDSDGAFRIVCEDLVRGKPSALRLTALQVNGATFTRRNLHFSVDDEGLVDAESLRQELLLAPAVAAMQRGRQRQAADLIAALPDNEPAKQFVSGMLTPPNQRPRVPDASAQQWSLCDLRPESASVGWRMPAYDYSPEDLLIRVKGKLRRRAIYAHAVSNYTYVLDPTWKTFSATCAVGDDRNSSVVFVVKVDGTERWQSQVVKPGMEVPCRIDLAGGKTLELIVHDAQDGNGGDHAFWIDPMIQRSAIP